MDAWRWRELLSTLSGKWTRKDPPPGFLVYTRLRPHVFLFLSTVCDDSLFMLVMPSHAPLLADCNAQHMHCWHRGLSVRCLPVPQNASNAIEASPHTLPK